MKNYIILTLLLSLCIPLSAQNKIFVSYNPGASLYNSENSTKTIGDKHIDWFPGFSVAFATENLSALNLFFEYNCTYRRIEEVQKFAITDMSPEIVNYTYADLMFLFHNVDLDVYYKANQWLSIYIGPTISWVNRTYVIDDLPASPVENIDKTFEDRLASLCLGANASVSVEIPLQNDVRYIFFFSNLKYRYLHSVWFDDRGRDLSNYHQKFLFSQLNIGLGYNF